MTLDQLEASLAKKLPQLDKDASGKIDLKDALAAISEEKDRLKAKATSMYNALIIAGLAFAAGASIALLFCRH